jgi:hypothetical protein
VAISGPWGLGRCSSPWKPEHNWRQGRLFPLPAPPHHKPPYSEKTRAVELIWPVISLIVLGSTMAHGLSVAAISIGGHYSRKDGERASLIGAETNALHRMDHGNDEDSEPSIGGDESP